MIDLHIDDFHRDISLALVKLFNAFPAKHTIYLDEICGEDNKDEFGISSDRHQRCMGALMWLKDEGLIRIDDILPHEGIDQAILTMPTYLLLVRITHQADGQSSKQPKLGFIQEIRTALSSGSSEQVNRVMEKFLMKWHSVQKSN
ncbi:MAG: hypothetical protein AAGB12_04505 [Pseudomonadota bacterium]